MQISEILCSSIYQETIHINQYDFLSNIKLGGKHESFYGHLRNT